MSHVVNMEPLNSLLDYNVLQQVKFILLMADMSRKFQAGDGLSISIGFRLSTRLSVVEPGSDSCPCGTKRMKAALARSVAAIIETIEKVFSGSRGGIGNFFPAAPVKTCMLHGIRHHDRFQHPSRTLRYSIPPEGCRCPGNR